MRYRATCLGYVRVEVSGLGLLWDQAQIRKVAAKLIRRMDVVTVTPEETFARRDSPPWPDLPHGQTDRA